MYEIIWKVVRLDEKGNRKPSEVIAALPQKYKTEGAAKAAMTKKGLNKSEVLPDGGFYCYDVRPTLAKGVVC